MSGPHCEFISLVGRGDVKRVDGDMGGLGRHYRLHHFTTPGAFAGLL